VCVCTLVYLLGSRAPQKSQAGDDDDDECKPYNTPNTPNTGFCLVHLHFHNDLPEILQSRVSAAHHWSLAYLSPIITLGKSFSILLHFEWFKMLYRSALSSSTNHLWNAKPKKSCTKNKNIFSIYKTCFFFFPFFSFWRLLLHHQCITFSFYVIFKLSKINCFEITILRSTTHHLLTLKAT